MSQSKDDISIQIIALNEQIQKLEAEKKGLLEMHKNMPRTTETHRYMRAEIFQQIDKIDAKLDGLKSDLNEMELESELQVAHQ